MPKATVRVCGLLVSAALLCAAQLPAQTEQQQQSAAKAINDPAEYNAYITALNTPDPSQRAAAMEAFVASYPDSVVRAEALEQAMAAYQQAGKLPEAEKVAKQLLQLDEHNVRALAILVALTRDALGSGKGNIKAADLRLLAERGLKAMEDWQLADISEVDFGKLAGQAKVIFYGGAGFGALMEKDYAAARDYYPKALAIDPNDLANNYQLSIADLEMANPDVKGFWYVARAIHICDVQHNEVSAKFIARYAEAKYRRYHGSLQGWQGILNRVAIATNPDPPRDFQVERAAVESAGPSGTEAALMSNFSPGDSHGVSASLLSSSTTGTAHATPASVLSGASPGDGHNVAASVLSADNTGATVQSSNARHPGNASQSVAASILHAAGASATAVKRSMAAFGRSLAQNAAKF